MNKFVPIAYTSDDTGKRTGCYFALDADLPQLKVSGLESNAIPLKPPNPKVDSRIQSRLDRHKKPRRDVLPIDGKAHK